jgi:phage protein D
MSATNTQITVEAAVLVGSEWIELTKHITKLSHTLSNVEASSASITINSEHMNYKLDDFQYLANGQTIVFRYGYLNQSNDMAPAMSSRYTFIIGDINYQYGNAGSKFILKLISKGYFMKKVGLRKVWKGITASQIAIKIAELHGLKAFVDDSFFVYESLPQGITDNYNFLKKMALLEDGFVFFVRSNELHFKKVGTDTPPIFNLDVRGAIVKDFNLSWQEIEESKKISTMFSDEGGFSTEKSLETVTAIGEGLLSTVDGVLFDSNGKLFGGIIKAVGGEPNEEKQVPKKELTREEKKKLVAALEKPVDDRWFYEKIMDTNLSPEQQKYREAVKKIDPNPYNLPKNPGLSLPSVGGGSIPAKTTTTTTSTKTTTTKTTKQQDMAGKLMEEVKVNTTSFVDNTVNSVLKIGDQVITQVESVAQKEMGFLSENLKSKRKELTGDVSLVGVPYLVNDKTLYIENIHSRFVGIYYIESVTHRIEEQYSTDIRINRHGITRLDDPKPGGGTGFGDPPPQFEVPKKPEYEFDIEKDVIVDSDGTVKSGLKQTVPAVKEKDLDNSQK